MAVSFLMSLRTFKYGLVVDDIQAYRFSPQDKKCRKCAHADKCYGQKKFKDVKEQKAFVEERKAFAKVCLDEKYKNWKRDRDIVKRVRRFFYGAKAFPTISADRTFSIVIHTTVSMMIYFVFGHDVVSFLAGLLFALNPVTSSVSTWLNGKRFGVNAILAMLMWHFAPWGALLYVCVPFLQISAVPALLLYLLTPYWWIALIAPVLLLPAKGFLKKLLKSRESFTPKYSELYIIKPKKIIIVIKTIGFYFWHCLFPRRVVMYYGFLAEFGMTDEGNKNGYALNWDFFKGIVAISLCIAAMVFYPHTIISLGAFWFLIFMLPCCNVRIFIQTVADRYAYLSLVGFMLALVGIMAQLDGLGLLGIFFMLGVYITQNIIFIPTFYSDIVSLANHNVFFEKGAVISWVIKIAQAVKQKHFAEAFGHAQTAIKLFPRDKRILMLNALCFIKSAQWEQAEKYLKRADMFPMITTDDVIVEMSKAMWLMIKNKDTNIEKLEGRV